MTPLMAALVGKQASTAEELLHLGISVGKKDRDGNTAYHYSVLYCPPLVAVSIMLFRYAWYLSNI